MSFSISASDRGMFDPNFPLQGIFDSDIFDTPLAPAAGTIILPIYVHGNNTISVLVHGNEEITLK